MLTIDRFVDEAIEEEMAGATAADESWSDLSRPEGGPRPRLLTDVERTLARNAVNQIGLAIRSVLPDDPTIGAILTGSFDPSLQAARTRILQIVNNLTAYSGNPKKSRETRTQLRGLVQRFTAFSNVIQRVRGVQKPAIRRDEIRRVLEILSSRLRDASNS